MFHNIESYIDVTISAEYLESRMGDNIVYRHFAFEYLNFVYRFSSDSHSSLHTKGAQVSRERLID